MNDAPEILTFHDDEGNPCDFEYIGTVEHEGSTVQHFTRIVSVDHNWDDA